jgi:hypothetical protein
MKKAVIGTVLMFLILLDASTLVQAATGSLESFDYYIESPPCESLFASIFNVTGQNDDFDGRDNVASIVFNAGKPIVGYIAAIPVGETQRQGWSIALRYINPLKPGPLTSVLYDYSQVPPTYHNYQELYQAIIDQGVVLDSITINPGIDYPDCGYMALDGNVFEPGDGRLNNDPGALAVVYAPSDGSFQVYGVDESSNGYPVFYLSKDELAALPGTPEQDTEIKRTDDGRFRLYELTTGELQLNVGPDAEGKEFVYIFSRDPIALVRSYDFKPGETPS